MQPEVAVLNFGIGNVSSVIRACDFLNIKAVLTNDPDTILSAKRLIVPGDGAYGDTMKQLRVHGLIQPVLTFVKCGKPFLGICVGMQILADYGEEFGRHEGLSLIPGKVIRFKDTPGYKIPQIGWNQLHKPAVNRLWNKTILNQVKVDDWVYFVHSYIFVPDRNEHIQATTTYADQVYCSVIKKDNIYGTQFHPEKSGLVGLAILKQFLYEK